MPYYKTPKKFYSTPEVASWFDITDAQLRYYIKPFEHYIFDNMTDNPSTTTLIRLNLPSILKLRIFLPIFRDEMKSYTLKKCIVHFFKLYLGLLRYEY